MERIPIIAVALALLVGCQKPLPDFHEGKRLRFKDPSKLKPEFDLCPWWNRSMSWSDYLEVRRKLERPALYQYVDKIQASQHYRDQGYDVVPVYHYGRDRTPFIDKLQGLKRFVGKPSHMSVSNGLTIYREGHMLLEDFQEAMFALLDRPSNSNEWYLNNMPRGFLVQEFIDPPLEVKFHTVWGRTATVTALGFMEGEARWYDREGNPLKHETQFPYPDLLKRGNELAERIAERSDALRVDFLVRTAEDGSHKLLLNEMEVRSGTAGPDGHSLVQLIHLGYEGMCEPY